MINWTLSLAQEGASHGIRANCICPGIVDTPIHSFHHQDFEEKEKSKKQYAKFQLLESLGEATQIAESIYFLASELSAFTTGSVLNVDGGINIK
jgi:NAD(P)-dependent dehydrogenase (short-subunit alcohol dehydrogenase family)